MKSHHPVLMPPSGKRCMGCDTTYHTRQEWDALRLCGVQCDGHGAPDLILRDCTCGSTLALVIAGGPSAAEEMDSWRTK